MMISGLCSSPDIILGEGNISKSTYKVIFWSLGIEFAMFNSTTTNNNNNDSNNNNNLLHKTSKIENFESSCKKYLLKAVKNGKFNESQHGI